MSTAAHSEPDTAEVRKARGAFFTPQRIADFIACWAIRGEHETVMEPSCGEAAFLLSASRRLNELGADDLSSGHQLHGVELHADSAARAAALLAAQGAGSTIDVGDFFLVDPSPRFDAVVGNPPYVRYQSFSGESRVRSRGAALRAGVNLTALASSWAAFTVHAALFLKRGGRMGLVLPAELLSVNYASPVRKFLFERFRDVSIVLFEERVFPGVLEEVVLLLADGFDEGSAGHASIFQVKDPTELSDNLTAQKWTPASPEAKWTSSMMSGGARDIYASIVGGDSFARLNTWGETTLGAVTGNNKYFALSPHRVRELGLERKDVIALAPPGSKHLRSLRFSRSDWNALGASGSSTYLFRPPSEPSKAAREYISSGEAAGVNEAYKCRVRTPWWRVPLVPAPDLFVTYMNSDTPRFAANSARVHNLNSVHGLFLHPELRWVGSRALPLATLNSITLLGSEIVGRSYGGGMLKLEPREADELPVPSVDVVERSIEDLLAIERTVRARLRSNDLLGAVGCVDEVLRRNGFTIGNDALEHLREARRGLTARRVARGAEPGQG
ncbi:N-6 DNA methylase [Leifsonia sp. NPDC056824]|uniref:N-6 DNA methylase n=1 Tax=Leifsonia sp. NPDC056824 TaxID=3345953 RepID=UPI0036C63BE4